MQEVHIFSCKCIFGKVKDVRKGDNQQSGGARKPAVNVSKALRKNILLMDVKPVKLDRKEIIILVKASCFPSRFNC